MAACRRSSAVTAAGCAPRFFLPFRFPLEPVPLDDTPLAATTGVAGVSSCRAASTCSSSGWSASPLTTTTS
eukprot:CAMPEP_0175855992 /NCGR_PEP_ID=MMETSP0107_2-20121207/28243_1 /TAXON_ID=195067 ORGANISM="Goniomonas pacifica, Strain CCMP1869" /NCGR_SAMPLE_ID=MMETSP0107_2 /ASSEMBLY_ACC=CAM_ASM_000203 /LENGTH=70 /DNA_ID=CAMNT_0017172033 /DNA_START=57 /DNA_END=266 /DNA_ORIENTATION=-